jgi:hypothetical protein
MSGRMYVIELKGVRERFGRIYYDVRCYAEDGETKSRNEVVGEALLLHQIVLMCNGVPSDDCNGLRFAASPAIRSMFDETSRFDEGLTNLDRLVELASDVAAARFEFNEYWESLR